ncbi:MAG: hypothetical protein N2249_08785 [Melioribacter sp.]|nr:hypothetical protein [Melioribacter sp.]
MATINKSIFGSIKGSLGSVVFRERNGKIFVYSKPVKQKISKSKASVVARQKFSLAVALAKEINKNSILSNVWKQCNIKATNAYQKLIKANTNLTESNSLSLKNIITPPGLILSEVPINFKNEKLEITLESNKLAEELLNSNYLFCLIHLWNNKTSKLDFIIKLYQFEVSSFVKNKKQSFTIDLTSIKKSKYNNGLCLIAMIGMNAIKKKFFWSSTFAYKFL